MPTSYTSLLPSICLIGHTGAGKSFAAEYLVQEHGYRRLGFAGAMPDPHSGSPRAVVRAIWGDDAMNDRNKLIAIANAARAVDPDVWLNTLLHESSWMRPVVVDDCRFENEFWGLAARGFVTVRIVADRATRIARLKANGKWLSEDYLEHPIEHHLDDEDADYTIANNWGPDQLAEDLTDILDRERRRA